VCPCLIDGRNIIDHAKEAYCPLGKFRLGPGDILAAAFHRLGIRRMWLKLRGKSGCSKCAKRQTWMNRLWARLRGVT
jgi:hypothetical protein